LIIFWRFPWCGEIKLAMLAMALIAFVAETERLKKLKNPET